MAALTSWLAFLASFSMGWPASEIGRKTNVQMDSGAEYSVFVSLPEFERRTKRTLTDDDLRALQLRLVEDPDAGDVIAGTGGLRKIRVDGAHA